jgi:hypothetical protein
MAGSPAEERIRSKVEAALRQRKPDARIIHELVLTQGGERIDLAAVWDDGMILAEIKSERDTLSRLQRQLRSAGRIGCEVWLCLAEKWRAQIRVMSQGTVEAPPTRVTVRRGKESYGYTIVSQPNPCYVPELHSADVLTRYETADGFEPIQMHASWLHRPRTLNSAALLNMLWAEELRIVAGQPARASRGTCIAHALEHMTGREIRRGVCAALRSRPFPRADEVQDRAA